MSKWKTIETAPKDGTTIDLFTANGRVTDCRFIDGCWRVYGQDDFENTAWQKVEKDHGAITHWMKIPKPPTAY